MLDEFRVELRTATVPGFRKKQDNGERKSGQSADERHQENAHRDRIPSGRARVRIFGDIRLTYTIRGNFFSEVLVGRRSNHFSVRIILPSNHGSGIGSIRPSRKI